MKMIDSLVAEASATRRTVEAREEEVAALAREAARLESLFLRRTDRGPGHQVTNGPPDREAEAVHAALVDVKTRLGRARDQLSDGQEKLAQLDRLVNSGERAADAEKRLQAAIAEVRQAEIALQDLIDQAAKLRRLEGDALAAAHRDEQRQANLALGTLDEVARQLAGYVAEEPGLPAPDAASHRARAAGLDAAADAIEARMPVAQAAVDQARGRVREIEAALQEQRAYAAEIAHAEALGAYLGVLSAYRRQHIAAFGFMPSLPAYAQMADSLPTEDSTDEPVQAKRTARKASSAV